MEKLLIMQLLLLALHLLKAASQDMNFEGWLNIDCGSEEPGQTRSLWWSTDANFTKTGVNKQLPARRQEEALDEMNTVRFFPDQTQENCYAIPTSYNWPYIIRAGFLYGNYDGMSRPPTFDLKIDGEYWATVNTSRGVEEYWVPLYQETIYVSRSSDATKVCLEQTREGEVPFMSSLETMVIEDDLYTDMVPTYDTRLTDPPAAFLLLTRTNCAGPELRYGGGYYDDLRNRIWTSGVTPENCVNVSTPVARFDGFDNYPPLALFNDSISPVNASDPIVLTVDLPPFLDGPQSACCFIFYFCIPNHTTSGVRATEIYINSQMQYSAVTFQVANTKVVTLYPIDVVGPTINVTLAPAHNSTLSTLISGMEVFMKHDWPIPPSSPSAPFYYPPPSAATPPKLPSFMYLVLALVLLSVVAF